MYPIKSTFKYYSLFLVWAKIFLNKFKYVGQTGNTGLEQIIESMIVCLKFYIGRTPFYDKKKSNSQNFKPFIKFYIKDHSTFIRLNYEPNKFYTKDHSTFVRSNYVSKGF